MRKVYTQIPEKLQARQLKKSAAVTFVRFFAVVLLVASMPYNLFAQAPVISYSSPQIYTAGTVITPLVPGSSGVAAPGYNNSPLAIGGGLVSPFGVAADAAGNMYVADYGASQVKKIPFGGGARVSIGLGFNNPQGVAVDGKGNVYVADTGNGTITEIPDGGGPLIIVGSGFNNPTGVAIDGDGNIYVADYGNAAVKEIPAGGGVGIIIGSGFVHPFGVAVDAAGNVYVADYGASLVKKIPAGNGTPVTLGSGFNNPHGIAVDAIGNIYVADTGNNAVKELPVGGGDPVTLNFGFVSPTGVAVNGAGNVYAVDQNISTVGEITPVGGCFIGPFLPGGLSFDGATGIISGNPAKASPATIYTITAYNSNGSSTATLSITVNALSINYASPQIYPVGAVITPLAPTSSGVAAPGHNTSIFTIGSGLISPYDVAADNAGNVYVADYGANLIKKIPFGGGVPVSIGSGFSNAQAVATDTMGNVYVADTGNGAIKEIPVGGGDVITIATGFVTPTGLAVDGAGNIYVADFGSRLVKEIMAGGGATVTIGSGFVQPYGVAVDASGNVYVSDYGASLVKKVPAGNGAPVTLSLGFSNPHGIAVDAFGNVYVADYANNAVTELPVGSAPFTLGYGFVKPTGVAVNSSGNVYVTEQGNSVVREIKPNGGYYISPSLPAGLNFDANTGIISGKPVNVSPATTYTITAYNSGGSDTAHVSIEVANNNAYLSNLSLSSSTLNPVFAPLTDSYTANVANGIASVTITPVTADATATVKVNGTTVISGTASASIALTTGDNLISIAVTAQDGAVNTYSVTVTRSGSPNANLSGLSLSSGTLTPAFAPLTNVYTTSVSNTTTSLQITPTTADANATVKVNGILVTSGTPSAGMPLVIGPNYFRIIVTAQDGTVKTYALMLTRVPSINAILANLTLNRGTLSPAFVAAVNSYTASVSYTTTSIDVTPTTGDATSTLKVNNIKVASGVGSGALPLAVGPNVITIVVTAQDKTTTDTYTIIITRAPGPPSANLANLSPGKGSLTPAFATNTNAYTVGVTNATTSVTLTPITSDVTATVKVNGTPVISGTPSAGIPLSLGPNLIRTVVTASDGSVKTYFTTITRALSSNADLAGLVISRGTITPAFATLTAVYSVSVPNEVKSISITPITSDAAATVTVNNKSVVPSAATGDQPLTIGPNYFTIKVKAQDGTIKTYSLTVTRLPSTNAALSSLAISAGTLSPAFAAGINNYSASVSYTTTSIQVTATTSDAASTVKVNNLKAASGVTTGTLPLAIGPDTITTVVTAQDKVTTDSYTIIITRASPPPSANLANLTVDGGVLSPAFATGTRIYTASVTNAATTVTATTTDSTATVTLNGKMETSGKPSESLPLALGNNYFTVVVTAMDGTVKTYSLTVARTPGDSNSLNSNNFTSSDIERSPDSLKNDGIVVHQGVSPNGDGVNDFLVIEGITLYPDNRLTIMNRDGSVVYETKGYNNSSRIFDGHSNKNGAMQQPGTYFYSLEYKAAGSTKYKTGFIVLKY